MTQYVDFRRLQAGQWKQQTAILPDGAKAPAGYVDKDGRVGAIPYEFCLPLEFAELNLLPEVRTRALGLFGELRIPWHAGVDGGPSNHLLSSQVQCVNALTQMVDDPARIVEAFGGHLDIGRVEQIEPGRFLTFEFIGPTDFFVEARAGVRTRGAYCTSVDAAFLYQNRTGGRELALVEWKYTESYARRVDQQRDVERARRYQAALMAKDSPVDGSLLPFERFCDEPFYQLMRQQLLAHELEKVHALGADRVRVVHVSDASNVDYQASVHHPEHLALGGTVDDVWARLLRGRDGFVHVYSDLFWDPAITSQEYANRYSQRLIRDTGDLCVALNVTSEDQIEDTLEFDGDLDFLREGLELRVGTVGTLLAYPFTLAEVDELVADLMNGDS
jgi:hypothetical protein